MPNPSLPITPKSLRLSLLSLALGGFGIGLTEFVVMGLLPDIAQGLGVDIPTAGHMISAYALGVVFGAPLLVLIAGRFPPKKILLGLMVMFTVFNGLSSLAPNFTVLMLMRFLSGLPHGAFFGVGAVVAGRLAGEGNEASAIAIMFGGLTVCNFVGVPLVLTSVISLAGELHFFWSRSWEFARSSVLRCSCQNLKEQSADLFIMNLRFLKMQGFGMRSLSHRLALADCLLV